MKKLATLEQAMRRLAEREELLLGASVDGAYKERNRRVILALCEAYSDGYHDSIKDELRKAAR